MNKWQKGVLGNRIEADEKILKKVKKAYQEAEKEIDAKIESLLARTDTENLQSIIYQVDYQKALKSQISGILDNLNATQFTDVSDYLKKSYESGFIGVMYDLQGQGIPLIMPINQEQVVRVLKNNSKLSVHLWGALCDRNSALQGRLRKEMSRGVAQGHSYAQMAKRVADEMNIGYNNVARIVRTESHRIANEAAMDALYKAKEAGCDIVKQWDSTMDGRTRPEHQRLDGQIRELDKPFEVAGLTAQYPGGFGVASQDIYCRCAVLQRAKWALDEEELETLKQRAEYFGLDKSDDFEDYKEKYLNAINSPEFKNPYLDKKISLTPDGKFIEGEVLGNDIYEIDWDGTLDPSVETIIDASTGEAIPKSALKKIKDGEQYDQYTWSMNENGTFSKGIIKDQAQYKLDIPNNQVLTIDLSDLPEHKLEKFSDGSKATTFYGALPKDLAMEFEDIWHGADDAEEALKQVLKNNGYKAYNIINHGKHQDLLEDYFGVLDDSLIIKTKKSKLETLTDKLATNQKKLGKIDNKTYSGIWKDDVSVSDYADKKATIAAKKKYYNDQIAKYSGPAYADSPWAPNEIIKFNKYLDDLDEFEKLGKEYEKIQTQIDKIKKDITKYSPKLNVGDAYTQERKNNAYWFTNANGSTKGADAVYRDKCSEVWQAASKTERAAAHKYTSGSGSFNRPLRGYEGSWHNYKGVGKVDLNYEGSGKAIEHLTDLIDKSSYDFDIWLQRGVESRDGVAGFLGIDTRDLLLSQNELAQKLLGKTVKDEAFLSCAVAKGKGFSGPAIFNVYCPSGTKMLYCEPFSYYGHGDGVNWDGIKKQSSFGGEAEMLLQRGTEYRVTKVEKSGSRWYMDIEVLLKGE